MLPLGGLLIAVFALMCQSCNGDTVDTTPSAANKLEGMVETTSFSAENVTATKDTAGAINLSGTVNSDANFVTLASSDEVGTYEIPAVQGLNEIVDEIDSVQLAHETMYSADSAILLTNEYADSLVADWLGSLSSDYSFMFYVISDILYYSEGGTLEISSNDETLQRISGNFTYNLVNLTNGRKTINAIFEDVEYFESD